MGFGLQPWCGRVCGSRVRRGKGGHFNMRRSARMACLHTLTAWGVDCLVFLQALLAASEVLACLITANQIRQVLLPLQGEGWDGDGSDPLYA